MSDTTVIVVIELDEKTIELRLQYENIHAHGIQMLKRLDAMRKERQLCDVILTVEGHELFAHRALLSCHSMYFLELFLADEHVQLTKKQIYYQMDHLEYVALKLILQFIYRGSFHLTPELVPKLYLTAYQLRIEGIVKACSMYLSEQLTEQNCLSTRLLAMDDDLREKASECIQKNFTAVLDTREFHSVPTIKLELIESTMCQSKVMFNLVFNWIVQQVQQDERTLQELCDYMHLLYLNGEALHDCVAMNDTNEHFSDLIKDYQSYRLSKRNLSTVSTASTPSDDSMFDISTFPFFNHHLPSNLYTPETKRIHLSQSADHSYIAIAIINGRMLTISIHMALAPSSPNTPDTSSSVGPVDKFIDDQFLTHLNTPILSFDRNIPLVAPLITARCCFGIASIDDTIYVVGGYNRGDCLDTIEQFDPKQGKWNLFPSSLNSRRGRVSATVVQNRIYVCGGSDGQNELNTGECFDLKLMKKWSMIKQLSDPVAHSAVCSDDQYVYLIGGIEGDKCKNDCYRYDPTHNSWTRLASMNIERSQAGIVYFQEKIYVFGGSTLNRCLSSCEILTLPTNQWSMGPTMKESRRGCGVVLYHEKMFIIGGSNGVTSLTSVEIFDPKSNEWLFKMNGCSNELNVPRIGLGVCVCCDRIYAIGGFDGRKFIKSIEVYDENTRQWHLNH